MAADTAAQISRRRALPVARRLRVEPGKNFDHFVGEFAEAHAKIARKLTRRNAPSIPWHC